MLPAMERATAERQHRALDLAVRSTSTDSLRFEAGPGCGKTFAVLRALSQCTFESPTPLLVVATCTTLGMAKDMRTSVRQLGAAPRIKVFTVARLFMLRDTDTYGRQGAIRYYSQCIAPFGSAEPGGCPPMQYADVYNLVTHGSTLVVDEASQLEWQFFEFLDELCRFARRKDLRREMLPFCGLRVLVLGNLSQLPTMRTGADWQSSPYGTEEDKPSALFTHSPTIKRLGIMTLDVALRFFVGEARTANNVSQGIARARRRVQLTAAMRWGVLTPALKQFIVERHTAYELLRRRNPVRANELDRYPVSLEDTHGPDSALLGLHASNHEAQVRGVERLSELAHMRLRPLDDPGPAGHTLYLPAKNKDVEGSHAFAANELPVLGRVAYLEGLYVPDALYRVGMGLDKVRKKIGDSHDKEPKPAVKELLWLEKVHVPIEDARRAVRDEHTGALRWPAHFKMTFVFVERETRPKIVLKETDLAILTAPLTRERDYNRDASSVTIACITRPHALK